MRRSILLLLALCLAGLIGCSGAPGNVAEVTGLVTLDGEPLPLAMVEFHPASGGTPSFDRTDEQGRFELLYGRGVKGAEIGENKVVVTTYAPADPETDPPIEVTPEKVPDKYNIESELKVDVTKGTNDVKLELSSDGKITQPSE